MESGAFSQDGVEGAEKDDPFAEAEQEFEEQVGGEEAAKPRVIDREGNNLGEGAESVAPREGSDPFEDPDLATTFQDVPDRASSATQEQEQEASPAAAAAPAPAAATSPTAASATTDEPEATRESAAEAQHRQAVEAGEREAERRAEIEALDNRELIALADNSPERSLDLKLTTAIKSERLAAQRAAQAERPTSASSEAPGAADGAESEAEGKDGASDEPERPTPAATSPQAASGVSGAGDDADVAPPPEEKKGGTRRPYLLFVPRGKGGFDELFWYEDKNGKLVEKGSPGAKKQTVVLARAKKDALRHGYEVLGAPDGGASIAAVAQASWSLKHVEPDPIQPPRQRVKIS